MTDRETRSVSFSKEQADYINAQVASGQFAAADEVVSEALRRMQDDDAEIEQWLREEVLPTYDEMQAHQERGISAEEWLESIRKHHAAFHKPAE